MIQYILRFCVLSGNHFSFWTSSCLPAALTSNLTRRGFHFGLPRAFPLLQHPIRHSFLSLLDFLVPPRCSDVQSNTLWLPFWTSSCLPAALTSNLSLFLVPFGLPCDFSLLQRPICRAFLSLLDFLVPPLCFKVQSTPKISNIDIP